LNDERTDTPAGTDPPIPQWLWVVFSVMGVALLFIVFAIATNGNDDEGSESASDRTVATSASARMRATTLVPTPVVKDPASYERLDPRAFEFVVKNPAEHRGREIVLYGQVSQLDFRLGTDQFIALVDSVPQPSYYGGKRVAVEALSSDMLEDVVSGDLVTMYVRVAETQKYETESQREITLPTFDLDMIEVTGPGY
jgi:hypothetical protein